MDKGESIGALYVEIKAQNEISKELNKIQREAERGADNIEDQFRSIRLSIRTDLMKKSMSQIKQDYGKLKEEFEKQLKLDANYEDLEKLKVELEESEHALKRFKREADKTADEMDNSFFGKMKSKAMAFGTMMAAAFAGSALFSFLKDSVQAFGESEKAAATLEQQLGRTSIALNNYASEIQRTTTFEDDSVISAMALIAAFTKSEEQIMQLTGASIDLAAAKGIDLSTAADMVAKSFGSESNALARSGITLDAAAGSTERLKQVTEGISKLYAGQASAQAQTYTGKIENLKNRFGDLKENIGKALMPALESLGDIFGSTTDQINSAGSSMTVLQGIFNVFATILASAWMYLYAFGGTLGTIGATIAKLVTLDFSGAADAFQIGFKKIWDEAKRIGSAIGKMWEDKTVVVPVKFDSKSKTDKDTKDKNDNTGLLPKDEFRDAEAKLEAYYNEAKWKDEKYSEFLQKQWDKQKADMLKANMDKIQIDIWYNEQRKKAAQDFEVWWKEHGKRISKSPTYKKTEFGMEYQYEGVSELPIPGSNPFAPGGAPNNGVSPVNERLIPEAPGLGNPASEAVQDLTDNTIAGKLAFEGLGDAVANTLGLIKIQVGENASAISQIWAGMINGMIDKLAGLLAQWLLFNTLASFLPGAGFGAVSFKSLLGITEKAATGGHFLGTNNGILKLAAGGDFMVPQGFPNDSYPMLVQSGERVKVTPSGKIGDEARLLAEIKNAIEANTLDRRMLGTRPVVVQSKIQIGDRDLTKQVKTTEKTIAREGWKQE